MEFVDEKGSFDAEFNLLESTLTDLKEEGTNDIKQSVDEVPVPIGEPVLLVSDTIQISPCGPNYDSMDCEISSQCSKEIKDFNKLSLPIKTCESVSQHCESVNAPVSDMHNLCVSYCKTDVILVDKSTDLVCSSSKITNSNQNITKGNEIQTNEIFNDNNLNSDIVISICDSSVEQYLNNQLGSSEPSSFNCEKTENKDTDEMDLEITASKSNASDKNDTSNNSSRPTSKSGISDFISNESVPISNPGCSQIKSVTLDAEEDLKLKHSQNDILDSDTNLPSQNITNCDSSENKTIDIQLPSEAINSDNDDLETSKNVLLSNKEIVPAIVPNKHFCDGEKCETDLSKNCDAVVSLNLTPTKTEADICNLKNSQDFSKKSDKDVEKHEEHFNLYSSTPVVLNSHTSSENKQTPNLSNACDFGKMSPLDALCKKNRKDLKRKFLNLQCIDEVNEDNFDFSGEKKIKCNLEEDHDIPHSETENEENISSSTAPTCLEAPAKSILKKWQTSSFSRISGSSYYIVDECGECDVEKTQDAEGNASSSAPADEFEIACNSLNEELMKGGSFNIEGLEKYYSKVQLETQIDHDKFDEVLQELTFEIDDKKTLPVVLVGENEATKSHSTSTPVNEIEVHDSDLEKNKSMIQYDNEITPKEKNINNNINTDCDSENDPKVIVKVKDNIEVDEVERPNSSVSALGADESVVHNTEKNMTIIYADGEDLAKDEEDVLLEEDTSTKTKPYVFFEFVSSDPKENEDNYNPEWQKLGRLTTDEERYGTYSN